MLLQVYSMTNRCF